MKIHEAKIIYSIVAEGSEELLDVPEKTITYLEGIFDDAPFQEKVVIILLNRKCKPLGRHIATIGTTSEALLDPSTAFRAAIIAGASQIVVAHNHPSGDPSPSTADIAITRTLKEAGKILNIPVIDHIIVGTPKSDPAGLGFYSFRSMGIL